MVFNGISKVSKKLYENLGYKCVGELPDFYKKGINCYLMMKRRG